MNFQQTSFTQSILRQSDKDSLINKSKYNRKSIFKRAYYLMRSESLTLSEALKQAWKEAKDYVYLVRAEIERRIELKNNPYQTISESGFQKIMESVTSHN